MKTFTKIPKLTNTEYQKLGKTKKVKAIHLLDDFNEVVRVLEPSQPFCASSPHKLIYSEVLTLQQLYDTVGECVV